MNTLCIDNYVFRVGDYVETKDGEVGYIKEIVPAAGYNAPYIVCMLNNKEKKFYIAEIITYFSLKDYFSRIGLYDFTNDSAEENDIEPLVNSWILEGSVNKGKFHIDFREVIKKINELVDAVNKLREKVNDKV